MQLWQSHPCLTIWRLKDLHKMLLQQNDLIWSSNWFELNWVYPIVEWVELTWKMMCSIHALICYSKSKGEIEWYNVLCKICIVLWSHTCIQNRDYICRLSPHHLYIILLINYPNNTLARLQLSSTDKNIWIKCTYIYIK